MGNDPREPSGGVPVWAAALCVGGLALLAGFFLLNPIGPGNAREPIAKVPASFSDPATVRKVRTTMTFDGAPCQSCHDGTDPIQGDPRNKGVFHEKIEIKHGRNEHCFNCHNRKQPADFANFDGSPIKLEHVELLCAKCHGTTYRDWLYGAHGRRTGSWDKAKGGPKPTVCIACYNPHWPAFKPIQSAPPPHINPRSRGQSTHVPDENGEHE